MVPSHPDNVHARRPETLHIFWFAAKIKIFWVGVDRTPLDKRHFVADVGDVSAGQLRPDHSSRPGRPKLFDLRSSHAAERSHPSHGQHSQQRRVAVVRRQVSQQRTCSPLRVEIGHQRVTGRVKMSAVFHWILAVYRQHSQPGLQLVKRQNRQRRTPLPDRLDQLRLGRITSHRWRRITQYLRQQRQCLCQHSHRTPGHSKRPGRTKRSTERLLHRSPRPQRTQGFPADSRLHSVKSHSRRKRHSVQARSAREILCVNTQRRWPGHHLQTVDGWRQQRLLQRSRNAGVKSHRHWRWHWRRLHGRRHWRRHWRRHGRRR